MITCIFTSEKDTETTNIMWFHQRIIKTNNYVMIFYPHLSVKGPTSKWSDSGYSIMTLVGLAVQVLLLFLLHQ